MKNTKNLAGIFLFLSLLLYIVANLLNHKYPGMGFSYLIAFSEAAMVGGVADWFAVTALFRKPLNLPIPHTNLISKNKEKLGKNLSVFVRENFLSERYVKETINKVSLSSILADLIEPNKNYLKNISVKILRSAVGKLDNEKIQIYLKELAIKKLKNLNIKEITIRLLIDCYKKEKHHTIINFLLNQVSNWLSYESNRLLVIEYIKDIVKEDGGMFGSIKSYFVGEPDLKGALDLFIFKYNHSIGENLRKKIDNYVLDIINYIHTNKDCEKNIEQLKDSLIEKIDIQVILKNLIKEGKILLDKDLDSQDSKVIKQIEEMIDNFIFSLRNNEEVKSFIQSKALEYLPSLIINNGQKIDEYFVNYLNKLDDKEISSLIENKVGSDLQYIRINGTIVGGIIGLSIYSLSHFCSYLLNIIM